jgi:hypothetical protein
MKSLKVIATSSIVVFCLWLSGCGGEIKLTTFAAAGKMLGLECEAGPSSEGFAYPRELEYVDCRLSE